MDMNKIPKPMPIVFKLNSVNLVRASSATLDKKLEYKSICVLRESNDDVAWKEVEFEFDQVLTALAYISSTCFKSSMENPINDEAV